MKYEVHGFNCPKTCSEISSPFLIAHSKTSIQGRNSKLRVGLRCLPSIGKEVVEMLKRRQPALELKTMRVACSI